MDEEPENAATVRCPECGGDQVRWRVKRRPRSMARGQRNTLAWMCGSCGAGWEDPPEGAAGSGRSTGDEWEREPPHGHTSPGAAPRGIPRPPG